MTITRTDESVREDEVAGPGDFIIENPQGYLEFVKARDFDALFERVINAEGER